MKRIDVLILGILLCLAGLWVYHFYTTQTPPADPVLETNQGPWLFHFPTPDGGLDLGPQDYQTMTLEEVQAFIVLIEFIQVTHIGNEPDTIQAVGEKLLPRFFQQ